MPVERNSSVAGLKFVAHFAPVANVTYCLSEDTALWKVVHFVTAWCWVQPHTKASTESRRRVMAALNSMVHVV